MIQPTLLKSLVVLKFSQFPILRRQLSHFTPYVRPASIVVSIAFGIFILYSFWSPVSSFLHRLLSGPSTIISFTKDPSNTLENTNDRTNLLLLGKGGAGHDAPDLTDSMVIFSFHHPSKKVSLISIPRDIWVDSMKAKVNTAYYYGEQKQPNSGGLLLAKAAVYEITGLPIHYTFALDFEGFKQAIDLVGGIDVYIEQGFDDYKYPIPGMETAEPEELRYEHLHFDAGLEHMSGDRALMFVRSRMAQGDEGTDFARSKRQQKVILAFKDKMLNHQTLLSPTKLNELFGLYNQFIDTDITSNEYAAFIRLAISLDTQELKTVPLTTGNKEAEQLGVLENPPSSRYQGQWVLIARDNNWDALKQYIQNELSY